MLAFGRILWKWVPRTVLVLGLVVVLINAGLVPASSVPGGDAADLEVDWAGLVEGEMFPNSSAENDPGGGTGPLASEEYDRAELEQAIHEEVNDERANHSTRELTYRRDLQEVARGHSADMAERGYFAHESPDGRDMGDRYAGAGIDCPAIGENIAQSWYKTDVRTDAGTERYSTNEELAAAIVEQWMNSPGHRENILRSRFSSEGIGVKAVETGQGLKVYVTQNFCG